MPNEPEKSPQNKPLGTTTQIHTAQLPIDLASKVIVKPANDNTKMTIQQQPTFRTIQQAPQMRVVRMPTPAGSSTQIIQTQIMPQAILTKTGTMQTGRSTITVSKSPATANYLPRVTATLSTIQQKAGQQIRTPTPPVSGTAISPAFVRTSITPRTSSPTAVLSQGTAWVSGTGAIQMPTQLIRSAINAQNRTHILQPNTVTVTNNSGNAQIANIFSQQAAQQQNMNATTISVPATSGSNQQNQPTYVATVLPQRPQATIVYTSQQQQPFLQGQVQRMNIANTRQVRPIQRIPTGTGIRVNTSSINIRQNVPGLTPTTVLTTQNRASGNLVGNSTTISNTIPARIFQVATSQSPSGTQQVSIGQPNQKILQANVMTLPIIVNNNRLTHHTVKTPLQQGIIAHVSKLASGSVSNDGTIISNSITTSIPSNTMVASIQANQSNASTIQVSQANMQNQPTFSSQSANLANISNQGGSQIITVSQQQSQQLLSNQGNIHQQGQTVVPLQITPRGGNIPIKTITVSTSNQAGSLDHRNLSGSTNLQATTIMPIAKIVSQQQQQNLASVQSGNQSTPVFIHTRIPSTAANSQQQQQQQSSQVVTVSTPSSITQSGFSTNSATVYYEPASMSIAPSLVVSSDQTKTTSSVSNSDTYTVVSGPNVRYSEKMIHSIIANSFQQQNANNANQQAAQASNQAQTVRYSPLVVESQSQSNSVGLQNQSQQHQIITMSSGAIIQQQGPQMSQHPQTLSVESILASIPSSPHSNIRKNETTPVKMTKQKMSKAISKLEQKVISTMIPSSSTISPPKVALSLARKQSECNEESSDDGSTTVSIPNSPSKSEEEDLDAMIMSNQFNMKKNDSEDLSKFQPKSAQKIPSSVKRELSDHQMTPRKKLKTASERMAAAVANVSSALEVVEKAEMAENIENMKKREFILKKPQASLLMSYNQTWKPAPNHFMRYSDVRTREDRRVASVMDLANQPRVLQRINGWKTYLIKAEIDEVISDETHEMEILTNVLKRLETKESGTDAEKINELIKGNVQRSRLIIDSLNDSKTQLMKIFDHKDHAADIINRCASKRNFKKR